MKYIVLDFETYYSKDYSLKKMDNISYIMDPRYQTIGCAVCELIEGDEEEEIKWFEGDEVADWLREQGDDVAIIGHNMMFDGAILSFRYNYQPKLYIDTMGMARALLLHQMPRPSAALGNLCSHFGLGEKGKEIADVKNYRLEDMKAAGLYEPFVEYAKKDVYLTTKLFRMMRYDFPPQEYVVQDTLVRMVTQPKFEINLGLLLTYHQDVVNKKQELIASCGVKKLELMSDIKFAELLRGRGIEPPTKVSPTNGNTVYAFAKTDEAMAELAEHPDPLVQALVAARLGNRSTIEETRAQRFIDIARATLLGMEKSVMPVPLLYSGAHTHRFSGAWKLNLQNLSARGENNTLRSALVAPEGYRVIACDSSQIEARISAWLCGQTDLVQAFADKEDVYCKFGSSLYGRQITKADKSERFISKTAVLGLQYGLGHVKFHKAINAQARQYGIAVDIDENEANRIVQVYRNTYESIRNTWYYLSDVINGMVNGAVTCTKWGPVLFEADSVLLPSGLRLNYHNLRRDNGELFYSHGGLTRRLYGPKVLENITQALARIAVVDSAIEVQRATGIRLAHTVHDENVFVVPEPMVKEFSAVLLEAMRKVPDWAKGLPLDAELHVGSSYGECK